MATVDKPIFSKKDKQKILLVGNVSKIFLEPDLAVKNHYEVCDDMLDAIEVTAKNHFAVIGVVIAGTSANLGSALKSLRNNYDGKIILLAQMYEEPIAIQLVGQSYNGKNLADDYFICPLEANELYEFIASSKDRRRTGAISTATANETIEKKIRLLEKLATEDDLTGLKNRRYIWEFARQVIEQAQKTDGKVTLLVFDIDNFKYYNDIYGHCAGDEVLKQATVLMRRCCRSHDVVGRIGGDEFAVVFWDSTMPGYGSLRRDEQKPPAKEAERRSATADHPKEAIFIATRFRKEFEKAELPLLGPQGKGILTISGGLASYPRDGSTIQQLFQQADNALLEAKRGGKNRIYLVGKPQSDIADIK